MPRSALAARRVVGRGLATYCGGKAWLLRDDFTTDCAAGSVNGTAAEPGPGTRVASSANGGTVRITSGKLALKGGGVYFSDAMLSYAAITRTAGRIIEFLGVQVVSSAFGSIGLDPVLAAQPVLQAGWYFTDSGPAVELKARNISRVGGIATYDLAVVLRSAGAFYFDKVSGNWVLRWIDSPGSSASLYPFSCEYVAVERTVDSIRVPDALWLPTPLVSDGFGSAFGTSDGLGHAEGIAGGVGAGGSGFAWSNVGGTWSVSGGKAINTPVPGGNVLTNGDFSAWTGDNPNGWTLPVAEDANNYATEVSGALRFVATAGSLFRLEQNSLNSNTWYAGVVDVSSVTTIISLASNAGSPTITITTSGSKTWTGRAAGTYARIWTANSTGAGTIDNFAFKPIVLSELLALSNPVCSDVFASVIITRPNTYTQPGLALNWNSSTSPTGGVVVYLNNSIITIEKCVAGVWSHVANANFTYSAGAPLTVVKTGTEYRAFYNGGLVTAQTISDAGIVNNTLHGLFSTDASNTLDNFVCYATGAGGEYAILDQYIQP